MNMNMNPIKQERIERKLTQEDFARLCHMTVGSLVKYELGLYQRISPKILRNLKNLSQPSQRYKEWQHRQRASNKWRFRHVVPSTLDGHSKPDVNPMITLLEITDCPSLYALATWLCVHQDVLARYAGCRKKTSPGSGCRKSNSSGCRKMPPLIRNALSEVIPVSTVDHIELLMRGYDE